MIWKLPRADSTIRVSRRLLEHHFRSARAETAPGSAHALDLNGLKSPDISFWSVWDGQTQVIGIGALKRLSETDAEIKSMHTVESFRGRAWAVPCSDISSRKRAG